MAQAVELTVLLLTRCGCNHREIPYVMVCAGEDVIVGGNGGVVERLVAMGVTDVSSKQRAGVVGLRLQGGRVVAFKAQGVLPQEGVLQRGRQALHKGCSLGLGRLGGSGWKRIDKMLSYQSFTHCVLRPWLTHKSNCTSQSAAKCNSAIVSVQLCVTGVTIVCDWCYICNGCYSCV